jgi:hypothetical protein
MAGCHRTKDINFKANQSSIHHLIAFDLVGENCHLLLTNDKSICKILSS